MTAEEKTATKAGRVKAASNDGKADGAETATPASSLAELIGKPVSASRSEMVEVVLPNDANPLGYILGGRVMHLMDIAGAIAAHRHSSGHVVTASVDYVDFRHSIKVGELIILKSSVNRVFKTSMEVGVKVFSESTFTSERKHTSSAYLTFVAIDAQRQPRPIPPLILETDEDRRRWQEAEARRKARLALRYKAESDREKEKGEKR